MTSRKPDAIFEPGETPTDNRPAVYAPRTIFDALEDFERAMVNAASAINRVMESAVPAIQMLAAAIESADRDEKESARKRSRDDLRRKRRELHSRKSNRGRG